MIRDHNAPVNGWLYQQIRLLAEHRHIDSAETLLEAWIREKLDESPEIAELVSLRAKHKKLADEEWKAKYDKPPQPAPELLSPIANTPAPA